MQWSPKQASYLAHSDAFINVADGAIRSGKTHAALARFAEFCLTAPSGDLAVFGKTERTVKRNVVNELKRLLPGAVRYVQGAGELYVFGRLCWVIGANNIAAEEKVRGMTLAGAYCNEVTLYPQEVFDQTIARTLTIPDARIFADCNPDSPYHWMNTDYLEAGHSRDYLKRWRFRLPDNPILTDDAIDKAKALWGKGSLFYRRNIDGEWVLAEGSVYDMFSPQEHLVSDWRDVWGQPKAPPFEKVVVGADYGTATVTALVALGLYRGVWYAFDEHRYDAQGTGKQKTDAEHSLDVQRFMFRIGARASSIEMDPSAASFKLQLKNDGVRPIRDANNDVLDGIRVTGTALTAGTLKIHANCEQLIREFPSYVWDEKAQERGEDKPMKAHDHSLDALRYAIMRAIGVRQLAEVHSF